MRKNNLKNWYESHHYNKINRLYTNDKTREKSDEKCMYTGFGLLETGFPANALDYLLNVDIEKLNTYAGKIYRYIGLSRFSLCEYHLSRESFELGVMNGDHESYLWKSLLFPSLSDIRETNLMNFRFINNFSEKEKKIFMYKNISAFKRIIKFIGKEYTGKKIDIYIYNQRIDSIGNSLSYSDNGLKTIHLYANDINGHELAHILFNNVYKNMQRNRFIDEGIATFFDNQLTFKEFVNRNKSFILNENVLKLWKHSQINNSLDRSYYYLAGAFIGYLIETFGKTKFMKFLEIETIENAKKVFGDSFNTAVNEFYKELV